TSILGSFALLGLTLAAIGIYGVISYAVSRRTRELGIRMALGAHKSDVLRLVIRQGMRPAILGTLVGLPATYALTRLMKSFLFGFSATDPLTYSATAALLMTVAALACYLPALRATRVDPLTALRHE
ncbi:MAG: FtsX-like permease family protein, partial [Candidatus Acidiferrales bacterium]